MASQPEQAKASLERLLDDVLQRLNAGQVPEIAREEFTRELALLRVELGTQRGDALRKVVPSTPSDAEPEPQIDLTSLAKSAGSPSSELIDRLAAHAPKESRYQIEGEIARGGMGVVLRAFDPDLRRSLAMKLALEPNEDPKKRRERTTRFLEEAQVTGQLDHPGIVPVHELGLDSKGRLFFTMRLVRGRDLGAIYKLAHSSEEGWSTTRVLGVLLKVCEALAYAHSKGVVHRDLKPANVMVGRFGEVYVMDWGLAKVVGRESSPTKANARDARGSDASQLDVVRVAERALDPSTSLVTRDGTVLGTPAYMSPEQARGDIDHMDARSDVYSLGAMIYHLLAGMAPYHDVSEKRDGRGLWERVMEGPPTPLSQLAPNVPAELAAVCERAMAHAPQARYASVIELAEDLRAFLENRVVHAYETGAWAELRKWVRRNRSAALSTAVLIVGLIFGSIAFAIHEQRAQRQLRLTSDTFLADALVKRAKPLLQVDTRLRPMLDQWLADADELMARKDLHAPAPASPSADVKQVQAASLDDKRASEPTASAHPTQLPEMRFAQYQSALGQLVGEQGLIARLREHRRAMDDYEAASLRSPEAIARWNEAITSIADRVECPMYDGLALTPQFGLLPIGRGPVSKLWEFAYLPTGTPPTRDPSTGLLVIDDASAAVFVLVPAGFGELPAPRPRREREIEQQKRPARRVAVQPFFLSKYEFTQAQWQRLTGTNPSRFQPGFVPDREVAQYTRPALHPVEMVSPDDCTSVLEVVGLRLPTDAEWARAHGPEDSNRSQRPIIERDSHSSVDATIANSLGLHGINGNVGEWCREVPRDEVESVVVPTYRARDFQRGPPDRRGPERGGTPERGGPENGEPEDAGPALAHERDARIGVRPARSLVP